MQDGGIRRLSSSPTDRESPTLGVAEHPPGPRGLPYIGCLLRVLRNPMAVMAKVAQRYGGIARIPLRGKFLYLVSEPELLRELLVTHRQKYAKNIRYHHMQALVGQGLLLSEGDEWHRQRLITQPAFKADYIHAQVEWMAEDTRRFLDGWRPVADSGSAIDVAPEFARLAQLLAGRYLMGPGFTAIAAQFCDAAAAIKKSWPQPPRGIWDLLRPQPKSRLKEFEAAVAALDECIFGYLKAHRPADFAGCGVLELIVRSSRAEGRAFTDRELRDQLSTLFFAGHETSATALCWIHYFLSLHPDVRARVQREVGSVLGGRDPSAQDLPKLQYTEQVVQEAMRLYSPIHAISRVALVDNTLGGYRIPAGTTVTVSMYATHRLPQHWPDPERFDPERFTPEHCAARSRFAYLPFAAGHRNCIGGGQAMVELRMVVAQVAQRYVLDLVPGQKIEPAPGTTMYPRHGMRMTLRHAGSRQ